MKATLCERAHLRLDVDEDEVPRPREHLADGDVVDDVRELVHGGDRLREAH